MKNRKFQRNKNDISKEKILQMLKEKSFIQKKKE